VTTLRDALAGKGIDCHLLPIRHGFHSSFMNPVEPLFRADCASLRRGSFEIPLYSSVLRGVVETVDDDYLWKICRSRFNFRTALLLATEAYPNVSIHDVGPSGTSATHAKAIVGSGTEIHHAARLVAAADAV
jgi:acyl transferase domain-containing protein